MRRGRPNRFVFLIEQLDDELCYAPATIAALITEEDLAAFGKKHGGPLTLDNLRLRARTTLAAYRRRHISIPFSGFAKAGDTNANLFAWYGKIWKSAFGLLQDNTLHKEA